MLDLGDKESDTTKGVLITQLIGFPGCLLSVYLIPRIGRKQMQLLGTQEHNPPHVHVMLFDLMMTVLELVGITVMFTIYVV